MPSSPPRPFSIGTPPTMRRPSFFRKRSNSLPAHRIVNIPAEEAGLIFSAAERAAARRRRPLSESFQSPAARLIQAEDLSAPPTTLYTFETSPFVPTPPTMVQTPSRAPKPSPLVFSTLATDITESRASVVSSNTAVDSIPSPHADSLMSVDPISPKRVVPNFTLKAYADSLFQFTHGRLEVVAPPQTETSGLLVPRLQMYEPSPPNTPGFAETVRFRRPELQSRFSDWSQTTGDVESRGQSQWASALHTPDEAALMSPDSFFAEITPRVAQFARRDVGSLPGSPLACMTRADSPTQGRTSFLDMDLSAPLSASNLSYTSPRATEPSSYFFGFDGPASLAMNSTPESPWPLKPTVEDVLRSPSTPASLMPPATPAWHTTDGWSNTSMLTSSASDSTPYHRRISNMPDPSFRPPSWLVQAIG